MPGFPYKPKVFISHSTEASDPRAVSFLDRLHQMLTAAKNTDGTEAFEILLDRKNLNTGVEWRKVIDDWISSCDAAIVLLSEAATRSEYVKHEVSLLQAKHELILLPVCFPSVTDEDLKKRMDPQQIIERQIQRLTENNDDEIIEKLLSQLRLLPQRIPRHDIEQRLFNFFCSSSIDLRGISDALAVGNVMVSTRIDSAHRIVRTLLGAELESDSVRFSRLRLVLDRLRVKLDLDQSLLLNWVFPFCWVNAEAAGKLPNIAARTPRTRAVAWAREWGLSEQMYLLRGFCHPNAVTVYISNLDGGIGVGGKDSFLDHIASCLTQELLYQPFDKARFEDVKKRLYRKIQQREDEGKPVFLILPLELADKEKVKIILDEFPNITLFFYSKCLTQTEFADLGFPGTDFLTPPLDLDAERAAYEEYGNLLQLIGQPLDKLNNPQSLAR
jgi:TIR domain